MLYGVGEYKDKNKYLKHSLKVADEMENLIKEILSVAMIKDENFKLKEEDFNISKMLEKIYKKHNGLAEDKKIEIIPDIQESYNYKGYERLLEKAISNIVGNAITYSPSKEKVFITFKDNIINIENTDIHIEEENLKQLFDPFFRIDKSRSRNTGGSGLGLYIAKTVFDYHNIQYKIENTKRGVLFTIILPSNR